jgi:hypothetical protein
MNKERFKWQIVVFTIEDIRKTKISGVTRKSRVSMAFALCMDGSARLPKMNAQIAAAKTAATAATAAMVVTVNTARQGPQGPQGLQGPQARQDSLG